MMDFSLTQDQQILQDSVSRFLTMRHDFEARRKLLASGAGLDTDLWAEFSDLGWLSLPFAEHDGGLGGSLKDVALVMEQFGRHLVFQPWLANVMLAGQCLALAGDESVKQRILEPMMAGETQLALAHSEPDARFDLACVTTMAKQTDHGYVLSGHKCTVLNGDQAQWLVVSARTRGESRNPDGISLFLVPATTKGIIRNRGIAADGSSLAEIRLDHVVVEPTALLGTPHGALTIIQSVVDAATVAICAEALGCMDQLLHDTVEYTKTRQQFGVPISSFQVLQHRMVDMFIQTEQVRALLDVATHQAMYGEPGEARRSLAALKAFLGRAGRYVAQQGVQLHGGMGITDELATGHFFKRLTLIMLMFGDEAWHLRQMAAA